MAKADKYIVGTHPTLGTLWAAIDEGAHHLEGRVAERRFPAFLAPFRSRQEAEAALVKAGAVPERAVA